MNRELLLPEMQRKYVWRATQARDLLDSIYRDYPSGSILIWETDNLPEVKSPSFEQTKQEPIGKRLLLLDGQQRITCLASILTGRPVRIKEGTKIKEKFIDLFFNIDHPEEEKGDSSETPQFAVGDLVEAKREDGQFYPGRILMVDTNRYYIQYNDNVADWSDETRDLDEEKRRELYFQVKNKNIDNKPNWISVTKLFKEGVGSILKDLKMGYDHPDFNRTNPRLNQLYNRKDNYLYPIQIIRDKSYDEVTNIFIRVNSFGTRLRGSDLALAQITSTWRGSMKLFEDFADQCRSESFYLDENFLARCLVCIATRQAQFSGMKRMSADKLKDAWDLAKKGLENAINFVKNNAYVDSSALLPSQTLLIPLALYSSNHDLCETPEIEKGFLYWFYNAAIWGRYSGAMETKLSQDLIAFSNNEKPWVILVNNIWQVVGKDRKIVVADWRGKTITSPLFFMMYVLARINKARDLETGTIISYENFGKNNKMENDHIFPKSRLGKSLKNNIDNAQKRKRLINEICNIAFMTKKGNIIKTNDDPDIYFPKVYEKYGGEDYFEHQQIPYDLDLLTYDKYERFLNKRAAKLTEKINGLLDSLK